MSVTTPASPKPGVAPATGARLSAEEFLHHMSALQVHYGPGGAGLQAVAVRYVLPPHIAQMAVQRRPSPPAAATAAHPPQVRAAAAGAIAEALRNAEQDTLRFVQSHHDALAAAARAAASGTAGFVARMAALEQAELADHAARIAKLFAEMVAVGQAHPGQQAHILVASNGVGGFLAELLNGAHDAGRGIATLFGGAAHATAAAVHEAVAAAGHWASGAVASVGHFFKSIF